MANDEIQSIVSTELGLIDIELPMSPEVNWLAGIQLGWLWLLIVLFLAGLVFVWLTFKNHSKPFKKQSLFWHFFILRWQVYNLQKSLNAVKNQSKELNVTKKQVNAFYELVQRLVYIDALLVQSQSLFTEASHDDKTNLQRQANLFAFSGKAVSRETFMLQVDECAELVKKQTGFKTMWAFYFRSHNGIAKTMKETRKQP